MAPFLRVLHHPQGVLLVTGPTGSGKTTTLLPRTCTNNGAWVKVSEPERWYWAAFGSLHNAVSSAGLIIRFSVSSVGMSGPARAPAAGGSAQRVRPRRRA